MFLMSAETVGLSTHALRKAEVLFQHCHTRGKPVLIYLHAYIFYTHQQLVTKKKFREQTTKPKKQQLTTS